MLLCLSVVMVSYSIIKSLANEQEVSPTGFTMSVHNTCAGLFTIEIKKNIPVSSLSAGIDSFQQGLLEAQAMLITGKKKVLLIDFDGQIPAVYHNKVSSFQSGLVYAVGLVMVNGKNFACQQKIRTPRKPLVSLPQSLVFLKSYLLKKAAFTIVGTRTQWQWQLSYA